MFNFSDVKEGSFMIPSKAKLKRDALFLGVERDTQTKAMIFNFREKEGNASLSHREFVPTRQETATDEQYKGSIQGTVSRIAHICRAFVTEEEFLSVKVEDPTNLAKAQDNWISITQQVGKLLKAKLTASPGGLPCEIKVVYSKNKDKYYAALPKVPSFISTTNHPKDFSINPTYDIFEIPSAVPTAMPNQAGGLGSAANQAGSANPLPPGGGGTQAASGNDDF